jgi:hypothetical protein
MRDAAARLAKHSGKPFASREDGTTAGTRRRRLITGAPVRIGLASPRRYAASGTRLVLVGYRFKSNDTVSVH